MQQLALYLKNHRSLLSTAIFGCLLLILVTFFLGIWELNAENSNSAPFSWQKSPRSIYTYPDLLTTFKDPAAHDDIFFGLCMVLQLPFFALLLSSRKLWVFPLYFLMIAAQCFVSFAVAMNGFDNGGEYLYHQKTVKFENQVYHLTLEKKWSTDPGYEYWAVFLFECDNTGVMCSVLHSRSEDSNRYSFEEKPNASLKVNAESDTLELIVEDQKVFTIPAVKDKDPA